MKCNICRAELKPDHYYEFTKILWQANDEYGYEGVYDITLKVCDTCEKDLMRMYRELREDIAEHI